MLTVGQAVKRLRCKRAKAHEHARIVLADDVSIHNIQFKRRHARELISVFQDAFLHHERRLLDGKTADVCLPRGICAKAEGGNIRILCGDDVHILKRDAERLCRHLRKGRIRPLTDLCFPHLKLHGAILIEHHPAGGGFE